MADLDRNVAKYLAVLNSMINSIAKAGFDKSVVLTGGLSLCMKLLEANKSELCRKTVDIDLDISSVEEYLRLMDNIVDILNDNENGFVFSVRGNRELKGVSAGIKLLCDCVGEQLKDIKIDFNIKKFSSVEVCFVDALPVPTYDDYEAVCDKFSVVCSNTVYRRVKDVYDISCYSQLREFSSGVIRSRLNNHNIDIEKLELILLPENIEKLEHAYVRNNALPRNSFRDTFSRAAVFANPLLMLLKRKEESELVWDIHSGEWKG